MIVIDRFEQQFAAIILIDKSCGMFWLRPVPDLLLMLSVFCINRSKQAVSSFHPIRTMVLTLPMLLALTTTTTAHAGAARQHWVGDTNDNRENNHPSHNLVPFA
jgi:putative copper export protein